MHPLIALTLPLFLPLAAHAKAGDPTPGPYGHYRGNIEIPASPLEIDVTLDEKGGKARGHISIPAQKLTEMQLSDVKVSADAVSFAMPGIPGEPHFDGKPVADGIRGTFTQGGASFPFLLRRLDPKAEAQAALKDLDSLVDKALKDFHVPGVAVGVVKDGEVVLLKGYGMRNVEKHQPVTPRTLFAIGSTTKAFTTVVMQQLVEEARLDWNAPVRTYLPQFTLKDEYASAHMTPRDLVTHVSGLPRHDLVWYNNLSATREDILRKLAFLEPNKTFRQQWQYNNMMFMTAGLLVEKITAKSWEANVKTRIFTPLKMTHSNFSVKDSARDRDHAEPYKEHKDELLHLHFRDITTAGPAGSINSCVEDMTRWMLMHLEGGAVDGKKVLLPSSITELHTPRASIPTAGEDPAVPVQAYASGWGVDVYRGMRRVHHGGGIDGFITEVALFPDQHLGVVVLSNSSSVGLSGTLAKTVADRMLGLAPRDWLGEDAKKYAQRKSIEKEADKNKTAAQVTGTQPSRALDMFAGRYEDLAYGRVDVTFKDSALSAVYNNIKMPLQHWHYDVFRSAEQKKEPDFEGLMFNFRSNDLGEIDAVDIPLEQSVAPIHFLRQPDARLSDPAFLVGLAGDYELASHVLRVEVRSQSLVFSQDGGAPLEMLPQRGLGFSLKGISGMRMEFVLGPDGKTATSMKFIQPSGMVTATRKK